MNDCGLRGSLPSKVDEIPLTHSRDERGLLTAAQFPSQVPFLVKRIFVVSDVEPGGLHGGHAHHIPPLVWALQEYLTLGASLLVLASHEYDINDYIDDQLDAAKLRIEATASLVGD